MSRRVRNTALPMRKAGDIEKADPERAVALYRESILGFLEAAADPLDQEAVRHDLLLVFDRLSLVLKREGQAEEALEEIDSAASLGLLDCRDHGIKGHREALCRSAGRACATRWTEGPLPPPDGSPARGAKPRAARLRLFRHDLDQTGPQDAGAARPGP